MFVSGIAAFIGAAVLTRESRAAHAATADVRGTAIATAGLLALLYPLVEGLWGAPSAFRV